MNNDLKVIKKHFSELGLMYFVGILLVYIIQVAAIFIAEAIAGSEILMDSDISFWIMMLPMYIIGYPIMILLVKRVPIEQEYTEKKSMKVGQLFVAFLMSYGIVVVTNYIGVGITGIIGYLKQGEVQNVVNNIVSGVSPLPTFVVMVILAPIFEEIIMRKMLIDRAVKYGEGLAIALSGLLFGLFHANLNQFVFAFAMGCFYGFIYVRTRKIIYTIIMHMINNFLSIFLSILVKLFDCTEILTATTQEEIESIAAANPIGYSVYTVYSGALIVAALVGIILLLVKRKKFFIVKTEQDIPKRKRFSTVICNVGMILFCGFELINIVFQLFQ